MWSLVSQTNKIRSCRLSILHIYCTAKPGGGGKPNLVGFNPYTYWTQKILSVYLAPCGKNWGYGFYESGGPKINKI